MFALPLTDTAELRPLSPWHAEEFLANLDRAREHISPWVSPSFVATDLDGAKRVLDRYAERWARDDGGIWGIWDDNVLVGGVLFVSLNVQVGVCEAGCWLVPAASRRGLVTRGLKIMLDWAFDVRGMHRVEWHASSANQPSINVARRLGMSREGVLRENYPHRGVRTDTEVWAVLAPEWRTAREGAAHSGR